MADLAFTARLYRLRRDLCHEPELRASPLASSAATARTAARSCDPKDCGVVVDLMLDVWAKLASVYPNESPANDVGTALQFPPPYRGEPFRELLCKLTARLLTVPTKDKEGNLVIDGALGVGKTTILRAFCAIAVLCFDYLVVFWDYEQRGQNQDEGFRLLTASDAVLTTAQWLQAGDLDQPLALAAPPHDGPSDVSSITPTIMRMLATFSPLPHIEEEEKWGGGENEEEGDTKEDMENNKYKGVVFFGDEITSLYAPLSQGGRCAVANLVCNGKQPRWLNVLSGSSTQLARMVFRAHDSVEAANGYPSLNASVYSLSTLKPMREASQIQDYCQARYGEEAPADTLKFTGGVGRHIHEYLRLGRCDPPSLRKMRDKLGGGDQDFLALATLFFIHCDDLLTPDWRLRTDGSVPRLPAIELPGNIEQSSIDEWCAESILMHHGGAIEFVIPCALEVVAEYFHRDMNGMEALALRVATRGWGSCGSARGRLEPLVLRSVFHGVPAFRRGVLHRGGRVHEQDEPRRPSTRDPYLLGEALANLEIGEYSDVIQVPKDKGLDGFFVRRGQNTRLSRNQSYDVHVLQIKWGMRGKTLTPGVLKTQRAIHSSSHMDDTCIAGIVAIAERGMRALRSTLGAILPTGSRIQFCSLTLCTNKTLTNAAEDMVRTLKIKGMQRRSNPQHVMVISGDALEEKLPSWARQILS